MNTSDQVIGIIARQLHRDPAEFTLETDLQEAGFESIDVIETMFALEEAFGIDVNFNANDEDIAFTTVGDVVSLVEAELAKKASA